MLRHSPGSCSRKRWFANPRKRGGNICILVAIACTALIGVVAVAVDGGMLMDRKSHVRATADAAALAGASYLYENYPSFNGTDPYDLAEWIASNYAAKNGYLNSSGDADVEVHVPPKTGPYAGKTGHIEVIITYYQQRGFSRIFGTSTLPVRARAVARGAWVAPNAGVIVLDYTGKATLSSQGNGAFTEVGAPVLVNSNNASAMVDTGNGLLKAPQFRITGNYTSSGNGEIVTEPVAGNILTGVHPTPDPLAYLPVPTQPAAGTMTTESLGGGNTKYTLTPGTYYNLPNFNTGDIVILKQASAGNGGIYYLASGGFNSQGATLNMDSGTSGGIMIYNAGTGSSDALNITGNSAGSVNVSPLTTGVYKGITYFQNRAGTQEMHIKGNGTFNIYGTLYAAGAELEVEGNGALSNIGSQYITRELAISGNGNVAITYQGDKVGRTRIITLVE